MGIACYKVAHMYGEHCSICYTSLYIYVFTEFLILTTHSLVPRPPPFSSSAFVYYTERKLKNYKTWRPGNEARLLTYVQYIVTEICSSVEYCNCTISSPSLLPPLYSWVTWCSLRMHYVKPTFSTTLTLWCGPTSPWSASRYTHRHIHTSLVSSRSLVLHTTKSTKPPKRGVVCLLTSLEGRGLLVYLPRGTWSAC